MSGKKRARKKRRREARSVQRELGRAGALKRLVTVKLALREPTFTTQLQDAIAWAEVAPGIRSQDQIRDLALGVLRAMGLDTDGINLTVVWKPNDGRQLEFRAVLTMDVAEKAIAKAKERERGPDDDPPAAPAAVAQP